MASFLRLIRRLGLLSVLTAAGTSVSAIAGPVPAAPEVVTVQSAAPQVTASPVAPVPTPRPTPTPSAKTTPSRAPSTPVASPTPTASPTPEPTDEPTEGDGWTEVAVVPAAAPAPAPAPAGDVYVERGQAALAMLNYPWQTLGYDIVFLPGRPYYRAMTYFDEKRIEVYVRPGDELERIAFDLAHEIGHAVDYTYGTQERRSRWLQLRGIAAGTPWYGCSGCEDFATPAGDFAETFAYWQVGTAWQFSSRMAPLPGSAELNALTPLMQPAVRTTSSLTSSVLQVVDSAASNLVAIPGALTGK